MTPAVMWATVALTLVFLGVRNTKTFESWPFVCRVLWDPARALDLRDDKGEPDHSKMLPAIVMAGAFVFHALGIPMEWWELLIVGSLAYGYAGWRTLLKSGIFSGKWSNERKESITRTFVSKTRDPENGIDPV